MAPMKFHVACISALALLAGCATTTPPIDQAYEGTHRLSDTAVFIATDTKTATESYGQIHFVNDKPTNCWAQGCPFAVRVKPGRHKFAIRYAGERKMDVYNAAKILVEFDLQPRHVYIARYTTLANKEVVAKIEDLGEKPAYIPGRADRMSFEVGF
jgi:hypothetical protein